MPRNAIDKKNVTFNEPIVGRHRLKSLRAKSVDSGSGTARTSGSDNEDGRFRLPANPYVSASKKLIQRSNSGGKSPSRGRSRNKRDSKSPIHPPSYVNLGALLKEKQKDNNDATKSIANRKRGVGKSLPPLPTNKSKKPIDINNNQKDEKPKRTKAWRNYPKPWLQGIQSQLPLKPPDDPEAFIRRRKIRLNHSIPRTPDFFLDTDAYPRTPSNLGPKKSTQLMIHSFEEHNSQDGLNFDSAVRGVLRHPPPPRPSKSHPKRKVEFSKMVQDLCNQAALENQMIQNLYAQPQPQYFNQQYFYDYQPAPTLYQPQTQQVYAIPIPMQRQQPEVFELSVESPAEEASPAQDEYDYEDDFISEEDENTDSNEREDSEEISVNGVSLSARRKGVPQTNYRSPQNSKKQQQLQTNAGDSSPSHLQSKNQRIEFPQTQHLDSHTNPLSPYRVSLPSMSPRNPNFSLYEFDQSFAPIEPRTLPLYQLNLGFQATHVNFPPSIPSVQTPRRVLSPRSYAALLLAPDSPYKGGIGTPPLLPRIPPIDSMFQPVTQPQQYLQESYNDIASSNSVNQTLCHTPQKQRMEQYHWDPRVKLQAQTQKFLNERFQNSAPPTRIDQSPQCGYCESHEQPPDAPQYYFSQPSFQTPQHPPVSLKSQQQRMAYRPPLAQTSPWGGVNFRTPLNAPLFLGTPPGYSHPVPQPPIHAYQQFVTQAETQENFRGIPLMTAQQPQGYGYSPYPPHLFYTPPSHVNSDTSTSIQLRKTNESTNLKSHCRKAPNTEAVPHKLVPASTRNLDSKEIQVTEDMNNNNTSKGPGKTFRDTPAKSKVDCGRVPKRSELTLSATASVSLPNCTSDLRNFDEDEMRILQKLREDLQSSNFSSAASHQQQFEPGKTPKRKISGHILANVKHYGHKYCPCFECRRAHGLYVNESHSLCCLEHETDYVRKNIADLGRFKRLTHNDPSVFFVDTPKGTKVPPPVTYVGRKGYGKVPGYLWKRKEEIDRDRRRRQYEEAKKALQEAQRLKQEELIKQFEKNERRRLAAKANFCRWRRANAESGGEGFSRANFQENVVKSQQQSRFLYVNGKVRKEVVNEKQAIAAAAAKKKSSNVVPSPNNAREYLYVLPEELKPQRKQKRSRSRAVTPQPEAIKKTQVSTKKDRSSKEYIKCNNLSQESESNNNNISVIDSNPIAAHASVPNPMIPNSFKLPPKVPVDRRNNIPVVMTEKLSKASIRKEMEDREIFESLAYMHQLRRCVSSAPGRIISPVINPRLTPAGPNFVSPVFGYRLHPVNSTPHPQKSHGGYPLRTTYDSFPDFRSRLI